MHLQTILYTTAKPRKGVYWFETYLPDAYEVMERTKGVTVAPVTIVPFKLPKEVLLSTEPNGTVTIDWQWFKDNLPADGHNAIGLHLTTKEAAALGLKHPNGGGLGGNYYIDEDDKLDFIVVGNSADTFDRLFPHEISHGFAHWTGTPDNTHWYDYDYKDVTAAFYTYDFTTWSVNKALVSAYQQLLSLMTTLFERKTITYPIEKSLFIDRVTQGFGVVNPRYRSGIHNGVDHGLPVGTPVYAPVVGEVYRVFKNHVSMGNAAYFRFNRKGKTYWMRFLHLREAPTVGAYSMGQVIGYTGSSGLSTGPHLHIEIFKVPVDTTILYSKQRVLTNLIDPYKWFRAEVDGITV